MRILTIIGARPQFIKAAMVSRAIAHHNKQGLGRPIIEEIIHTGQHYDPNMSEIFFQQMQIPEPVVNLSAGTGRHGAMTGRMLEQIEKEIVQRKPDWVLVYGDTNSTLAGALAAAKLHVPVVHVEAGLRSFNKCMPEEVNRVLTDHLATLLLCPTNAAITNLEREGITKGVHHVGDVMYDAAIVFGEIADEQSNILKDLGLPKSEYLLATVHRAENTDDPSRLKSVMRAIEDLAATYPVIIPLHPRTRKKLSEQGLRLKAVRVIEPVSFLDMVQLEKYAKCILTDSGGVQKEAYFHGIPCVTLREETEWVETVEAGWNKVAGTDYHAIIDATENANEGQSISEYGSGRTAEMIVRILASYAIC